MAWDSQLLQQKLKAEVAQHSSRETDRQRRKEVYRSEKKSGAKGVGNRGVGSRVGSLKELEKLGAEVAELKEAKAKQADEIEYLKGQLEAADAAKATAAGASLLGPLDVLGDGDSSAARQLKRLMEDVVSKEVGVVGTQCFGAMTYVRVSFAVHALTHIRTHARAHNLFCSFSLILRRTF